MIVHLAGIDLQYETILRQRCSWCGTLLIDQDLTRVALETPADGSDPAPYPTWPVGGWIARETPDGDGGVTWVLEPDPDNPLKAPAESCLRMPVEATR